MSGPDGNVAVFIMSCDRTMDIAQHFFAAFNRYWEDCSLPIYVGVNRQLSHLQYLKRAIPLEAEASGWRNETIEQLERLGDSNPKITHILVFLDDFILRKKVNNEKINSVINGACENNMAYLRFKPLDEGVWGAVKQRFIKGVQVGQERCFEIRSNHPYYSSLQVALWRLDHLRNMLVRSDNIWAFEHQIDMGEPHYSVSHTLLDYKHVVEKGEWDLGADSYCMEAIGCFNKGGRPMRSERGLRIRKIFHRIKFLCFGYSLMRLKHSLASIKKRQ